ncbi:MAG: hypothetical protein ACKO23_12285 [Gemmataceae bacterium]
MGGTQKAIEDWYNQQMREHHLGIYRTFLSGGDPDVTNPRDSELGAARRAEMDALPQTVREARDYYFEKIEKPDVGSVRVYAVRAAGMPTFAVRVRTDGDDGYLEVYDEMGQLLSCGRTYIEIVAWGKQDWLRRQVVSPDLPRELSDAARRTLWGKPLPPPEPKDEPEPKK